jgi:uncharacterized protein involved in exopolysaccharide biosynthesis
MARTEPTAKELRAQAKRVETREKQNAELRRSLKALGRERQALRAKEQAVVDRIAKMAKLTPGVLPIQEVADLTGYTRMTISRFIHDG